MAHPTCSHCCTKISSIHDILCFECSAHQLRQILTSKAWRETAATRTGDLPGETMLDTMTREGALFGVVV